MLSFIVALTYLLNIVNNTDTNMGTASGKSELEIKEIKYYMQSQEEASMFSPGNLQINWQERAGEGLIGYGKPGLMVPVKALRCRDCKKIIPWAQLRAGDIKCPFTDCGQELTDPKDPEDFEKKLVNRDTDGDGLPDRVEMRVGLDPANGNDADQDKDGDKYSNWFEYYCGSDITNNKSVPTLDKLLFVSRIRRVELPLALRGVFTRNPKDKNTYEIQVAVNRHSLTMMYNSGNINLNGVRYRFVDAIKREKSVQGTSSAFKEDDSTVYIMPVDSNDPKDRIEMRVGQKVYDPHKRTADLRDIRNPGRKIRIQQPNSSKKRSYVTVGDVFDIQGDGENAETGKCKVLAIQEKSVVLEYTPSAGKVRKVTLNLIDEENTLYQRLRSAYGSSNNSDLNAGQESMTPEPRQVPGRRSRGRRN